MDEDGPVERFARAASRAEAEGHLDEAALHLAAALDPDADLGAGLRGIDDLAAWVSEPTLDGLRAHLFGELGFAGDEDDYDHPRNSFLHEVLRRRKGLPIALSVLTREVGRRVGVPLAVVGLPGHVLLRDRVDPSVFVDPFRRGAVTDAEGCRALVAGVHPEVRFDETFLEPMPPTRVLLRMLANLAGSYRRRGDRRALTRVLELRAALPGAEAGNGRELALLLAAAGRYDEAARRLEAAAAARPGTEAATDDLRTAARLRARLN